MSEPFHRSYDYRYDGVLVGKWIDAARAEERETFRQTILAVLDATETWVEVDVDRDRIYRNGWRAAAREILARSKSSKIASEEAEMDSTDARYGQAVAHGQTVAAVIDRMDLVKRYAEGLPEKSRNILYAVAAYAMSITYTSTNLGEMNRVLEATKAVMPPEPAYKGCSLCKTFGTPGWVLVGSTWYGCYSCNSNNQWGLLQPKRINCLCWQTGVFHRLDGCPFHPREAT